MITLRLGRPGIRLFDPRKMLFFLWLFLLVLPKGGFKMGGVPITWGYFLLGVSCFFAFFRKTWKIQAPRNEILLCLIPFQAISFFTILVNGYEGSGMLISFLISFFLLPFFFFLIFSNDIETLDLSFFFNLLKKGVVFIACYGIFLFFFKQITGRFIEIPFLTTNWSDFGELETKNINRGFIFKLISTYNNGNIYGVCLLMLLPLYCFLEKNGWRKLIVKSSLFLTFSRTVWIGLIFSEICYDLFVLKNQKLLLGKIVLSLVLFSLVLTGFSYYFELSSEFFFDRNLGGRSGQFDSIETISLLSKNVFSGLFEMVYLAIIYSFGILGLIAFLLALANPIFLGFMRRPLTKLRICLILGLINYLFTSLSDGAALFIPTMAFFWFLASLLARKNLEFSFN